MTRIIAHLRTVGLALGVTLLWSAVALAGDASVRLQVQPDPAAMQRPVEVTVVISGAGARDARVVQTPRIDGLESLGAPRTAMQQSMSIDQGRVTQQVQKTVTFVFLPEREGTVSIPAIEVLVDGKSLRTTARTLRVQAAARSRSPFFDPNGARRRRQGGPEAPEMFVERLASRSRVYVGEPFRLDTELWVAPAEGSISGVDPMDLAARTGFWVERNALDGGFPRREARRNGGSFTVFTVRSEILVPTEAGTHVLGPERWRVLFRFGGRSLLARQHDLYPRAPETTVEVLPWPTAGRPEDFDGLVGNFTLAGHLDRDDARVGDALTWTLTLEGEGNLRTAGTLPEPDPVGFERFSSRADEQVAVADGRMVGSRTRELVLIPQRAGTLELPAVRVPYFDPRTGSYRFAETAAVEILVASGTVPGVESRVARAGAAPRERGTDIRYLRSVDGELRAYRDPLRAPWFLLGLALPPALVAGLVLRRQLARRHGVDTPTLRRRRALESFEQCLGALDRHSGTALAELSQALVVFLGERFGIGTVAVTSARLRAQAAGHGLDGEPIEELIALLGELDRGRFGGAGAGADVASLVERARTLARVLDAAGSPT